MSVFHFCHESVTVRENFEIDLSNNYLLILIIDIPEYSKMYHLLVLIRLWLNDKPTAISNRYYTLLGYTLSRWPQMIKICPNEVNEFSIKTILRHSILQENQVCNSTYHFEVSIIGGTVKYCISIFQQYCLLLKLFLQICIYMDIYMDVIDIHGYY